MSEQAKPELYTITVRFPIAEKPTIQNAVAQLPLDADDSRVSMNEWSSGVLLREARRVLDPQGRLRGLTEELTYIGLDELQVRKVIAICYPGLITAAEQAKSQNGGEPCQATS